MSERTSLWITYKPGDCFVMTTPSEGQGRERLLLVLNDNAFTVDVVDLYTCERMRLPGGFHRQCEALQ